MHENIPNLASRGPCRKCTLDISGDNLAISKSKTSKDGYQYQCKACHNRIAREGARRRYKQDPDYRARTKARASEHQKDRTRQFPKMYKALQSAYRCYVLEDDWKTEIEVAEEIYKVLADLMGDYQFVRWVNSIGNEEDRGPSWMAVGVGYRKKEVPK